MADGGAAPLTEPDVLAVLMVRAFEEADGEGLVLPRDHRERAPRRAREEVGEEAAHTPAGQQELLVHRARSLLPELQVRVPGAGRARAAARLGGVVTPLVVVIALLVGFGTNALGPDETVNVLAAPLVGLLGWNLLVYVVFALSLLRGERPPRELVVGAAAREGAGGARALRGVLFLGGLAHRLVERSLGRHAARRAEEQAVAVRAFGRFAADAGAASEVLLAVRLRRLLHLGALLLVFGIVAGMYVRGLGLRYEASWESTFLTADQVQALLDRVLAPAAWVLGTPVPGILTIEDPARGPAAPWIHLWAVAAGLVVLLPRAVFFVADSLLLRRLQRSLRLDLAAAGFRRQLADVRGAGTSVAVLPYGVHLEPRTRDALVACLHDAVGARAELDVAEPLAYGDEAADARLPGEHDGPVAAVVLFALAQSPEVEVHGRFAHDLAERLPPGSRLVAAVDAGDYAERVGDGARRLDERRRAWQRVLGEGGVPVVHLALGATLDEQAAGALAEALRAGDAPAGAGA